MISRIIFLNIILLSVACQQTDKQNTNTGTISQQISDAGTKPDTTKTATKTDDGNSLSDTFEIKTRSVTFFMLTQLEYDTLMEISGKDAQDVNEAFSDFTYYAEKTNKKLQESGDIKSDFVANKTFKIITKDGVKYFDRKRENMEMGVIIFDGINKLTIETGVMTDIDYSQLIQEKLK